jgi:hypothetical protein
MKHFYKPIGDSKQGFKLTIPASAQKAELYKCTVKEDGTLVYVPVRV